MGITIDDLREEYLRSYITVNHKYAPILLAINMYAKTDLLWAEGVINDHGAELVVHIPLDHNCEEDVAKLELRIARPDVTDLGVYCSKIGDIEGDVYIVIPVTSISAFVEAIVTSPYETGFGSTHKYVETYFAEELKSLASGRWDFKVRF